MSFRSDPMLLSLGSRRPQDQAPAPVARTVSRPRIGLALGGGSARGWAHIGVIRELEARGITADVIAGTSIGAVVGACAVAGKLDALESFARGLNRRRVFGLMDLSLGGTGLIAGARLKRRLMRDLGGLTIEALPKPFAAVATELGSGREVCLARGDVVEAIRASYALPGIFEPLPVAGRWLFDGAMSNPVPVSVCRALGADFVIAVNLTADLGGRPGEPEPEATIDPSLAELDNLATSVAVERVEPRRRAKMRRLLFARRRLFAGRPNGAPGIASVMVGAFSIAQERISRFRLAIDPPDVMIGARMMSAGLFDFHRAAELIEHGHRVARQALPEIEARLALAGHRRLGTNEG